MTTVQEVKKVIEIPRPGRTPRPQPADVCGVRPWKLWATFKGSRMTDGGAFENGVMFNVKFQARLERAGCGGEYTGHAFGDLLKGVYPKPEQLEGSKRLGFDTCTGHFYDAGSRMHVDHVTALFLLPGLGARYIP